MARGKTRRRGFFQGSNALPVILASIFLALQLTSLVHSAEHEFEHHEHDGIDCALSVFCDRLSNSDLPSQSDLIAPIGTPDHTLPLAANHETAPVYWRYARAPPLHA